MCAAVCARGRVIVRTNLILQPYAVAAHAAAYGLSYEMYWKPPAISAPKQEAILQCSQVAARMARRGAMPDANAVTGKIYDARTSLDL